MPSRSVTTRVFGDPLMISQMEEEIDRLDDKDMQQGQADDQNSSVKWVLEGKRNSKIFNLSATARRRKKRNCTDNLSFNKRVVEKPAEIKEAEAIARHFEAHYNQNNVLQVKELGFSPKVLKEESAGLLERPFTEAEVRGVIQKCEDSFNLGFFKRHWGTVKAEVMKFFTEFYTLNTFEESTNSMFITLIPKCVTFISLIPKCTNPSSLSDYRPICLAGSIYKILARVLANRLRLVMEEVIGENQFSLVKGKQIMDCSMRAIIDEVKKSGVGGILLKVDFENAYDSINWWFLDFVMMNMGFGEKWRKWIKVCVSTASLSVLVNRTPTRQFKISRGLQQGCPLSPFLFNLVSEVLSGLLHKAMAIDLFKGIRVGRDEVMISHLLYADNMIIFCEPKAEQILNVKRVLRWLQVTSGVKINIRKSSLIGIDQQSLERFAISIGCRTENLPSTFLALPLGAGRNSLTLWRLVVNKFEKRLPGWQSVSLSLTMKGRIVKIMLLLSIYLFVLVYTNQFSTCFNLVD